MLEVYLPSEFNMWWQLSAINAAVATLGACEVTRTELAAQKKHLNSTQLVFKSSNDVRRC